MLSCFLHFCRPVFVETGCELYRAYTPPENRVFQTCFKLPCVPKRAWMGGKPRQEHRFFPRTPFCKANTGLSGELLLSPNCCANNLADIDRIRFVHQGKHGRWSCTVCGRPAADRPSEIPVRSRTKRKENSLFCSEFRSCVKVEVAVLGSPS